MNQININRKGKLFAVGVAILSLLLFGMTLQAWAGADPAFSFYGYGEILSDPNPAIVGENTHVAVTVSNPGDADATNVEVKLSFNDWGVTFQGWQEIGTVLIPSIPAGDTAEVSFDHVFVNRTHTCLEALIVSADEDTNLNNDRGQINLEVLNAGESFEFYVPIVNNGDEEIVVQVVGECRQGPDGAVDGIWCRPIEEEIVVIPPGQDVLVPIAVEFPPHTPRGTPIDIDVNAFDALNPGDVNLRNHVRVRVVYNTARGLKEDSLAMLDGLPPLPNHTWGKNNNALKNRVHEIRRHIEKSLNPRLWVDDSHLAPRTVQRVYAQEMSAVIQMLQLIEKDSLPIEWKTELDACVRALTDADRILLQTAIQDAGAHAEAEAFLQEGDDLRRFGSYAQAIRHYGRGHVTVLK